MVASLVLLTPLGALAALGALLPLAAVLVALRAERRARETLRLQAPPAASRVPQLVALAAVPALLGLAAAQPALRSTVAERIRTDAQALYVVDVSRSMLASETPTSPTRFERAQAAAVRLRDALPQVPSGVATLTDRVLPSLLPVPSTTAFDDTVLHALALEQPPPQSSGVEATSLAALGAVGTQNFFPPSATRRLLVVLTDGESRPFDPQAVARSLGATHTILVRVGSASEQIFDGTKPEAGYHPDPQAGATLASLASAANGSSFGESELDAAARAEVAAAGHGPTTLHGTALRTHTLAPWLALLALVPLAAVVYRRRKAAALAAVAAALLLAPAAGAETYAQAGDRAQATLLRTFYAGNGLWRACARSTCPTLNVDWGVDSLTDALWLRWRATHDPAAATALGELARTAPAYPAACRSTSCDGWSDVPAWDAIAALREHDATGDPAALAKAKAAVAFVSDSAAYALGACPEIDYQQPGGGANRLKTLETDANLVKAQLLLARATGARGYLDAARTRYAAIRRWFLDPAVPLYSVYVFDDGTRCTQLPHRFFASVNGDMIWNGFELARQTGDAGYRRDALATAQAVATRLADPAGIFADLQAENDVVEPLVEAMLRVAQEEHAGFARRWILANEAAAAGERTASGAYGRFFDGPPPRGLVTAWQTNGALALAVAAAQLAPRARVTPTRAWGGARTVVRPLGLPSTVRFTGSAIAFLGPLGATCCEAGHARVLVDGRETFDGTGIWQNKSSLGARIPNTILFAWRWPRPGRHTISFLPAAENGKEGGSFLALDGYVVR